MVYVLAAASVGSSMQLKDLVAGIFEDRLLRSVAKKKQDLPLRLRQLCGNSG